MYCFTVSHSIVFSDFYEGSHRSLFSNWMRVVWCSASNSRRCVSCMSLTQFRIQSCWFNWEMVRFREIYLITVSQPDFRATISPNVLCLKKLVLNYVEECFAIGSDLLCEFWLKKSKLNINVTANFKSYRLKYTCSFSVAIVYIHHRTNSKDCTVSIQCIASLYLRNNMLVSRLCLLSSSLANKGISHCATLSYAHTLLSMHNLMVAKPLHTDMFLHNIDSYTVLTLSNIVEFYSKMRKD